jgi:uncharacterized protein (DUF433 family)
VCITLAAALARSHSLIGQQATIKARFSKQIMQTLTDIGTLIVRTPGTCGGRPRIAGTRITVQYIVTEIMAGMTPEEILENKPHLTLGGIYAAIAYYYANKEVLDAEFAAYEEECDRLEAEYLAGMRS